MEATRQEYFPEWIITGAALDRHQRIRGRTTSSSGRTRSDTGSTVRLPNDTTGANWLHEWYTGEQPAADETAGIAAAPK